MKNLTILFECVCVCVYPTNSSALLQNANFLRCALLAGWLVSFFFGRFGRPIMASSQVFLISILFSSGNVYGPIYVFNFIIFMQINMAIEREREEKKKTKIFRLFVVVRCRFLFFSSFFVCFEFMYWELFIERGQKSLWVDRVTSYQRRLS